jgi:hypothetical protein
VVTGFEKGLSIEGAPVVDNINGDTMVFANNILTNFAKPSWSSNNTNTQINSGGATAAWYQSWWSVDGNDSTQTLEQVNWVNIFTALGTTPDARLSSGSVAATGATFTNPFFYSVVSEPTVATTTYTYCQGANASQLTALASQGNMLSWHDAATGGITLSGTPTPNTSVPGVYYYYVSQKNSSGEESPRIPIIVTVNPLPVAPTISASGSTSFCTGGNVVLTSSVATGNTWSTNENTQAITVTTSGSYIVTVTDNNNCSEKSNTINVNVSSSPAPTISSTSTKACSGDTVTLTSSFADSYTWSNGANTQSIKVTTSGKYSVNTTNADACKGVGSSDEIEITFGKTPVAQGSFSTSGNVVTFTNTSSDATSYSWDFGDFTNSSATAPVHAYAVNGNYTAILTALNGTCKDTAQFSISITLSVEELMGISNLVVYPNPATDEVFVSFDNQNGKAISIELVDQLGRIVYTKSETQMIGFNTLGLKLSDVSEGLYSVLLHAGDNTIAKRVIIRK